MEKKKVRLPLVKTNLKAGGWWDDIKEKAGETWESSKGKLRDLNDKLKY